MKQPTEPTVCARCKVEDTRGTHQTVTAPGPFGRVQVHYCVMCWAEQVRAEPRAARRPRSDRGRRRR